MFSHDKCSLQKLDNFEIDFNLPKWQNRKTEGEAFLMYNKMLKGTNGWNVTSNITLQPSQVIHFTGNINGNIAGTVIKKKFNFFEMFLKKNRNKKDIEKSESLVYEAPEIVELEIVDQPPQISVEEFFTSVKNSVEEIELIKEKLDNFYKAIDNLRKMGQVALYEQMKMDVEVYRAEAQLYAIGMTKYLTESNIIKFAKNSDKALRLDWIKNFIRIIPKDVAEKKIKADGLHIFDGYLILHYDPDGKANEMTAQERADKEDPILFGVIVGSRKLYYVADWIDQWCNLTLDDIMIAIEEDTIPSLTAEL